MGTKKTAGFTIIEVMLFLAVSGALTVGILVGSGVAIAQQHYRDSVSSLKSLIQAQYNESANVTNSRSGDESCSNATIVAPPSSVTTPQARGTSDCLLMGRSITISADGTQVTTANVVGYRTDNTETVPVEATDSAELAHYKLTLSPIDQETDSLAWGARTVVPKTTTAQPLAMLIIHSPLSGSIMTYVSTSAQPDLSAFTSLGPNTAATNMCVEPSSGSYSGKQMAVRIDPYATSQSAIEIPSESDGVCG